MMSLVADVNSSFFGWQRQHQHQLISGGWFGSKEVGDHH